MRNAHGMEFSLAVSRRDILLNDLLALKGQQEWLENHIAVKSVNAKHLKNYIDNLEMKIAKALIKQAELENLAKTPKGLSAKQQQEREKCKEIIARQDEALRCKVTYNEWQDVDRENRLHIELLKHNQKQVRAELDQLPSRQKTPYNLSIVIREGNQSDTSNSMRLPRTR